MFLARPDLDAAKQVADYLGTVHHSYTFTVSDGIDAVSNVIKHLETFDGERNYSHYRAPV